MKINDIYESTTAGAIATVAAPMTTQSRNASIYGGKKGGNLLTGKKTSKKYANSVYESFTTKQQVIDHFVKQGKTAAQGASAWERGWRGPKSSNKPVANKERKDWAAKREKDQVHEGMDHQTKKELLRYADAFRMLEILEKAGVNVLEVRPGGESAARFLVDINGRQHLLTMNKQGGLSEAKLDEDDLILVPGQGHRLKSGFIPHDMDRRDHEVEMARSDLFQAAKNAKQIYEIIQDISEDEGLEGWVQEKIIKANDYLNTVREYLEHKQVQEMHGAGVIAGGGVGEGVGEKIKGAVRRMKDKEHPLQTRRDVAMTKGGQAYNKGETRKGNQYMAYAEKDRKKMGDPTTNPAGTYRTKTSDYANEAAGQKYEMRFSNGKTQRFVAGTPEEAKKKAKGLGATSLIKVSKDGMPQGKVNEAQTMSGALKNTLAKAEPGSKLDQSIKRHNANIKAGQAGTLKNAPTGYHFDKKGYCRLGDK